jgi:hypothetical protein
MTGVLKEENGVDTEKTGCVVKADWIGLMLPQPLSSSGCQELKEAKLLPERLLGSFLCGHLKFGLDFTF